MSKGGYDKLLRKYEEASADNLSLRAKLMERDQNFAELESAQAPKKGNREPRKQSKFGEFWTSTPVWGALTVPAAFVVSSWSVKAAYALVWGVLSFEFIRIRVAESANLRRLANALFSLTVAIGMVVGYQYLPKPKEQPNFDLALNRFGDSLVDKIAAKTKGTSTVVISQALPERHTHIAYAATEHLLEILIQKYHFPSLSLAPGNTPQIPMGFFNSGDYEVLNSQDAEVFIPVPTKEVNDAFGAARKTFKFSPIGGGVPPHQSEAYQYHTMYGPEITEGMRDQIYSGDTQLCAFGAVKWRDATGEYETDGAECLLVERFGAKFTYNWHDMQQNNREIKLQ